MPLSRTIFCVMLGVGRGWNALGQRNDVWHAPELIEQISSFQLIAERFQVDRFVGVVHIDDDVKKLLVIRAVEAVAFLTPDDREHAVDGVAFEEHRTEQRHFCVDVVRRNAIYGGVGRRAPAGSGRHGRLSPPALRRPRGTTFTCSAAGPEHYPPV